LLGYHRPLYGEGGIFPAATGSGKATTQNACVPGDLFLYTPQPCGPPLKAVWRGISVNRGFRRNA